MDLGRVRRDFERLSRRLFGLGFGSVVIRGGLQLIVTQGRLALKSLNKCRVSYRIWGAI
jgi:hypothetical protein